MWTLEYLCLIFGKASEYNLCNVSYKEFVFHNNCRVHNIEYILHKF